MSVLLCCLYCKGGKMSNSCKYLTLYNDLKEKIDTGIYQENDMLPSENELVKIYNVSRITVSKALHMLVDEGYITRKQGKGSFVSSKASHKIHRETHHPKKIGLLIPCISDIHALTLSYAMGTELAFPEYDLHIIQTHNLEYEAYSIKKLRNEGYDGLIIFPIDNEIYSDTILALQVDHFPYVLLDRRFQGIHSSYVISDNLYGGALCVKHLTELGHTKIAFCANSDLSEQSTENRYLGYMQELRRNQIEADENRVFFSLTDETISGFLAKIKSRQITAAIAVNTYTARYILQHCDRNGICVPEDLSLVCFDTPAMMDAKYSFLTYADQDSFQMGVQAAQIIKKLIDNPHIAPIQTILQPTLVANRSTRKNPS